MAFADLLGLDGVGWAWLVEVSFDDFSTVAHRWSTASYVDGSGNRYDGRLIKVGNLTRAIGTDGFPAAGTTELEVDNSDFAVDWLVDHSTWTTYIPAARFRLKLGLHDPGTSYAAHPTLTTQVMGEFVCLDFPSRTADMVKIALTDDSLGRIADLALAPSVNDWLSDGDTTAGNCPLVGSNPLRIGNWDAPIQLAFGSGQVRCNPIVGSYRTEPTGGSLFPIMVCATTDTDASGDTALSLVGQFKETLTVGGSDWRGQTLGIPATFVNDAGTVKTIWAIQRTGSISKDGKTWRLIWVQFNAANYMAWAKVALAPPDEASDGIVPQVTDPQYGLGGFVSGVYAWLAFECFWFQGYPLSARTSETFFQTGPDIIRDLIGYYSNGAAAGDIDTTSFDAVEAALGSYYVGGVVSADAGRSSFRGGISGLDKAGRSYGQNKLREVIGEILASIDADLSITWLGKYQLTALTATFAAITDARITIDETRIDGVQERTPSLGERFSPYNRVYVSDSQGQTLGPFDHPTELTAWGRAFPRTLEAKWVLDNNMEGYWSYVWQRRLIESAHRSLIRFVTDPYALQLDLGSIFELSWTRLQGGSTPYAATAWRVESLTLSPMTMRVDVEAVWWGDIDTEDPYLLDDETFLDISTGGGGRTLSLTATDQTATFSSGSLITDGVEVGDILVVKGGGAADSYLNNHASRITTVTDATHCEVVRSAWATQAGITTWEIRKGALTYPDSVSDATNYPDDGDMYGKASDESDNFSDSSNANLLKGG